MYKTLRERGRKRNNLEIIRQIKKIRKAVCRMQRERGKREAADRAEG